MKKLITLALCTGVIFLGAWTYNTNVNNTMITSSETNEIIDTNIIYLQQQTFESKKEYYKPKEKVIEVKKKESIPIYDIPLSKDLQEYIYKLSTKKNIPYELVLGVIKTESNFNPKAINKNTNGSTDKGLMQINSVHSKWCKELGITDLFDPYQNVIIGIELLSNLYKKYEDIHKTAMAYNLGVTGSERNFKVGRGKTDYSRKVVNNINIIKSNN